MTSRMARTTPGGSGDAVCQTGTSEGQCRRLQKRACSDVSALLDNIPVMVAVLAMDPAMSTGYWLLLTLTAGVGGSLLSIGSAAGVALMGQARGTYTFYIPRLEANRRRTRPPNQAVVDRSGLDEYPPASGRPLDLAAIDAFLEALAGIAPYALIQDGATIGESLPEI